MYNVSEEYKKAIYGKSRCTSISGFLTMKSGEILPIADKDLVKGSLTIENQAVNENDMGFGAVYVAQMSVSLYTQISRYKLYDGKLDLTFFLDLPDGTKEPVPLGTFTIAEAERSYTSVSIVAYDNMLKFDKSLSGSTIGTPYELITFCCKKCGMEFGMTKEEVEAFPNGTYAYSIFAENDIETYRDLLYYVCQTLCCFGYVGRDGKLYVKQFGQTPIDTLPHKHRFSSKFSDYVTHYTAINSTNKNIDVAEYYSLDTDDGTTINMGVNPLLQFSMIETRRTICENILQEVAKLKYVPFETTYSGNPAYDLGDCISFAGGHADEDEISCITHYAFKYHQKSTLKGVGSNPRLSTAKSKNDKNISGLLGSVKNAELSVFSFTNAEDIVLGTAAATIINIEFASTRQTNAEFKAAVLIDNINLGENSTAVLTAKYQIDDSFIVDFVPMQTVQPGKFILNLIYPLNEIEENTRHGIVVFLNLSSGSATIGQGQIKASVIGQGFAAGQVNWDGRIKVSDNFSPFTFDKEVFDVAGFDESVNVETQEPKSGSNITQSFTPFTFDDEIFEIAGFAANAQVSNVVKDQTVVIHELKNDYLTLYEGLRLQKEYHFESIESEIDNGRMSIVEVSADDMERIIGIETAENSSDSIKEDVVDLDRLKNKYLKNNKGLQYEEYFDFISAEKQVDVGRMSELIIQTNDIKEVLEIEVNDEL